jgi:hypothetical protein
MISQLGGRASARRFVDGRNVIEMFIRLVGTNDGYAYKRHSPPWGRHYGSSPIHCGLQVKTGPDLSNGC